jgi:hypothetical protein
LIEVRWPFGARLVPQLVSGLGATFAFLLLIAETYGTTAPARAGATRGHAPADFEMPYAGLSTSQIYRRALAYFLWVAGVLLAAYTIGLLPALVLFPFVFMIFHGSEDWKTAAIITLVMFGFLWLIFDRIVHEPWPQTVIGNYFPALRGFLPWF